MKRVIILLAFVCFWVQMNAQFSISGKISSAGEGALSGANIILKDSYRGTTTNLEGSYKLSGLKPGKYILLITYMGYETLEKPIEVIENLSLDIELRPAVHMGDEVIVKGTRTDQITPAISTNLSKEAIEERNFGQDLPVILGSLTSVVTTTDAGNGVGYTGLRIRGTDINRINVTLNGVPYNDPESHSVYWVDLPDIASSSENIQIQRGVGTSTNGAAAFGASINLQTSKLNSTPFAIADIDYGSFNTLKTNISFGTGLLKDKFTLDGRLSKISSDGFIDRAWSDLKSFSLTGGYYTDKTLIKIFTFSGLEDTYQSWNGVPKVRLENDLAGMQRYEEHGLYTAEETSQMINSNSRTYNLYTYGNEIDHYLQNHYQLHFSQKLNNWFMFNSTLFYIKGKGYYEQYKADEDLEDYDIPTIIIGEEEISSSDIIRQKWLDNDFYGISSNLILSGRTAKLVVGGGWNKYNGNHFGKVIWAEFAGDSKKDHEWYRNKGEKDDFNVYSKLNYFISKQLNLFADLQYRGIRYGIKGTDDNTEFIDMPGLDFDFFNPKTGILFTINDKNKVFASFAVAHREPNRSNYIDAPADKIPTSETLYDLEAGYSLNLSNLQVNISFYNMNYKDQLVLTGEINDVGDAIMINVPKSYRRGIEISSGITVSKLISVDGNLTLSRNKIIDFNESVDNWDYWNDPENLSRFITTVHKSTDISFSPSAIASGRINIKPVTGVTLNLMNKYVSRQYIDNTSSNDRSIDPYFINDLMISWKLNPRFLDELVFKLLVNNLFDKEYETNAWIYRYNYNGTQYNMDGYFPQAGLNILCGVNVKF